MPAKGADAFRQDKREVGMGKRSETEALNVLLMLQRRNMQRWAIPTIVVISLGAGLLAVTWPPAWYPADWHGPAFLPQAMVGLVVWGFLFRCYSLGQERRAGLSRSSRVRAG